MYLNHVIPQAISHLLVLRLEQHQVYWQKHSLQNTLYMRTRVKQVPHPKV